jgi:plasmid rolling circle replication initiator protein Rep
MTDEEKDYRDRSRRLYRAALVETNETLQNALLAQSERIGMKAIALELQRKQETLKAWGIPLLA